MIRMLRIAHESLLAIRGYKVNVDELRIINEGWVAILVAARGETCRREAHDGL